MPEFFSSDGPYFLQFLVIFLVILILLMGAVLLFRRLAGRGLSLSARTGNRARQPRLGIVDIYELDRQRQLILLRRDNVEHLLLVGGPNDVVVERNVVRGAGTRLPGETLMRPEPAPDFGPETERRDDAREDVRPGALPKPVAPTFEMPVVVPPPMPGVPIPAVPERAAAPPPAPPLDPGLFEPEAEPADRAPAPPATARIGISQLGRILRRTPPPLVDPRPEPASERTTGLERTPPAAAAPESARGAAQEAAQEAAQGIAEGAARGTSPEPARESTPPGRAPGAVDADILSDMTRQLETALRRQAEATTPPERPIPPPPPPMPAAPAPLPPSERVIATATTRPGPSAAPRPEPALDPVAAAMAGSQASPPVAEPPAAAPAPPAPSAPAPSPAAKPAPKPTPVQEPRPAQEAAALSVEEIESEFARLLGRSLDKKS